MILKINYIGDEHKIKKMPKFNNIKTELGRVHNSQRDINFWIKFRFFNYLAVCTSHQVIFFLLQQNTRELILSSSLNPIKACNFRFHFHIYNQRKRRTRVFEFFQSVTVPSFPSIFFTSSKISLCVAHFIY